MCRPAVVEATFSHYSGVGQSGITVVRVHGTTVADDLVSWSRSLAVLPVSCGQLARSGLTFSFPHPRTETVGWTPHSLLRASKRSSFVRMN